MPEKRAFLFLCDQETEAECLGRQLVGSPEDSALWVRIPGDADQDSGLMAIAVPGADADQKSTDPGTVIALPGIEFSNR